MTSDKQKEYYFSIFPLIIVWIPLIILLAVTFLLCFMFYYDIVHFEDVKYSYLIILVCLIFIPLLILLLSSAFENLIKSITCYIKKKPALILTKDELIDNLNSSRYKWAEIEKVTIETIDNPKSIPYDVIAIVLYDSENIINSISNPFKRYNAKFSKKRYGTSYLINTNTLNCKRQKLFEDLKQFLDNDRVLNSR